MMGFIMMFLFVMVGGLAFLAGLQHFGVLPRRDTAPGTGPGREDIHRLEEALGSVDARLERLEDQQRFLERLLEDRPERPSLPGPAEGEGPEETAGEVERGVDSILFDVEREEH